MGKSVVKKTDKKVLQAKTDTNKIKKDKDKHAKTAAAPTTVKNGTLKKQAPKDKSDSEDSTNSSDSENEIVESTTKAVKKSKSSKNTVSKVQKVQLIQTLPIRKRLNLGNQRIKI